MMNYAWDLANQKCFEWIIIMIIMIISFFQSHSIWFAKKEKVSSNKLYKNMGCDFFQLDYNHDTIPLPDTFCTPLFSLAVTFADAFHNHLN